MSKSSLVQVTIPAYSGNYTKGRSGRKIEAITIHHMAGVLTAEQCGKIFQAKGRNGSSHYGIGNDGKIALYVDESNTAWTNSNWDSNCKSVTIEVSNSKIGGQWLVSDNALNSLIKLVADIAKRNNLGTLVKGKNVTWHSMFIATACPGPYLLSKMDYIINEANKLNNGVTNNTKERVKELQRTLNNQYKCGLEVDGLFGPLTTNACSKNYLYKGKNAPLHIKWLQTRLKQLGYDLGRYGVDGSFGNDTLAAVKKFQKDKRIAIDGYVGKDTHKKLVE